MILIINHQYQYQSKMRQDYRLNKRSALASLGVPGAYAGSQWSLASFTVLIAIPWEGNMETALTVTHTLRSIAAHELLGSVVRQNWNCSS